MDQYSKEDHAVRPCLLFKENTIIQRTKCESCRMYILRVICTVRCCKSARTSWLACCNLDFLLSKTIEDHVNQTIFIHISITSNESGRSAMFSIWDISSNASERQHEYSLHKMKSISLTAPLPIFKQEFCSMNSILQLLIRLRSRIC